MFLGPSVHPVQVYKYIILHRNISTYIHVSIYIPIREHIHTDVVFTEVGVARIKKKTAHLRIGTNAGESSVCPRRSFRVSVDSVYRKRSSERFRWEDKLRIPVETGAAPNRWFRVVRPTAETTRGGLIDGGTDERRLPCGKLNKSHVPREAEREE